MFLQEIDLKNGNIGLNDNNQVIKIDGDYAFSGKQALFSDKSYNITPDSIAYLPVPKDFYVFHWLDFIQYEMMTVMENNDQRLVAPSLCNAISFRNEVNQALYKITLLSNQDIQRFVNLYMPPEFAPEFIELICSRRDQLAASALQNHSYCNYLNSPEAGANKLALEGQKRLMIDDVEQAQKETIVGHLGEKLDCLRHCNQCSNVTIEDPELESYYENYRDMIISIINNPDIDFESQLGVLEYLDRVITALLVVADSEESKSIKRLITETPPDSPHRADLIKFLVETPIIERVGDAFKAKCQEKILLFSTEKKLDLKQELHTLKSSIQAKEQDNPADIPNNSNLWPFRFNE